MNKIDGVTGIWKRESDKVRGPTSTSLNFVRKPRILMIQIGFGGANHYLEHPHLCEDAWEADDRATGSVVEFAKHCRILLLARLFNQKHVGKNRAPSNEELSLAYVRLNDMAALDKAQEVVADLFKRLLDGQSAGRVTSNRIYLSTRVDDLQVQIQRLQTQLVEMRVTLNYLTAKDSALLKKPGVSLEP